MDIVIYNKSTGVISQSVSLPEFLLSTLLLEDGEAYIESDGMVDDSLFFVSDGKIAPRTDIPPNDVSIWDSELNQWVECSELLNNKRLAEDWRQLKDERSRKIYSGVLVESTGKVFQTDNNSLTQYASIAGMIALDNYEPIEWKTEGNSFVLLTVDIFKELQKAINENTQSAFRVAEQKRVADQPS